MLGRLPAKQVQIIFNEEMINPDDHKDRFSVNVIHDVFHVQRELAGLCIQFTEDSPEYFHPWHIIKRTRIIRR